LRKSSSGIVVPNSDEDLASGSQNPSRRLRQPLSGFENHLQNTAITYNFSEEEINLLSTQKGEIIRRINHLTNDLESSNPNINIIQQYKLRLQDFKEKE
jgi:hypothetical protein